MPRRLPSADMLNVTMPMPRTACTISSWLWALGRPGFAMDVIVGPDRIYRWKSDDLLERVEILGPGPDVDHSQHVTVLEFDGGHRFPSLVDAEGHDVDSGDAITE